MNNEVTHGLSNTPLPIVAQVTRLVTKIVDRLTSDRNEVPLLTAAAAQYLLSKHKIGSQVMYGPAAWIEIMDDQSIAWAGCWGQSFHFWVATQFGEVVDLNTSVAYRRRSHLNPQVIPIISPPILWSREVPRFYRYKPEGVAELEITDSKDSELFEKIKREIDEKFELTSSKNEIPDLSDFPNEAVLCPNKKILDDSRQAFAHLDRILSVKGIPSAPF